MNFTDTQPRKRLKTLTAVVYKRIVYYKPPYPTADGAKSRRGG